MSSKRQAPAVKGLKRQLPVKVCEVCQRPMAWRKSWAKNWDAVKYCSEACRRNKTSSTATPSRQLTP